MLNALRIFTGSGLGGVARRGASGVIAARFGLTFPWGTLGVNVTRSLIIGAFATLTGPEGRFLSPTSLRQFFMPGVCGAYTTFSSSSLPMRKLAGDGPLFRAGANVVLSAALCLLGGWQGHNLAPGLNSPKGS